MCITLSSLRQFIWQDFPSSGCCFRSLILHASACGWMGRCSLPDSTLTPDNWQSVTDELEDHLRSGFLPRWKEKLHLFGCFGGLWFHHFLSACVWIWVFYSNKAFLAMWQACFFVFFITFRLFFPRAGWSKIVCYVSVNFRRLKCDCDYGRGAATDIRGLCEELPNSFPT